MRKFRICSFLVSICLLNLLCTKPSSSSQPERPFLSADKQTISVIAIAGWDTIRANSNEDWSIVNLPSWINASAMNGTKDETVVVIQYSANESPKERAGDITIRL